MIEIVRDYAGIAVGLSEATAIRAVGLARFMAVQSAEMSIKAPGLLATSAIDAVDDVTGATTKTADVLSDVMRTEVQRVLARLGYVREEELAAVRSHVQRLERTLHRRHSESGAAASDAGVRAPRQGAQAPGREGSEAPGDRGNTE